MSGHSLIYANKNRERFWHLLSKLKTNSNHSSPLYSEDILKYRSQLLIDSNTRATDCSFILSLDGEPYFCLIAFSIDHNDKKIFSTGEQPIISYEKTNLSLKQKKCVFSQLSSLFQLGSSVISVDNFDNNHYALMTEWLMQYSECTIRNEYYRCIDTSLSIDWIWRRVRESHRSYINKGLKNLGIHIYDDCNLSYEVFKQFRELHISAAGRETRSLDSWDRQYEAIQNGTAFCVFGYRLNSLVTAGYFVVDCDNCYYGSSASNRELFKDPLFHPIMWKAILYAKSKNINSFDTGVDHLSFQDSHNYLSDKEKHIAKFKAGFGGLLKSRTYVSLNL